MEVHGNEISVNKIYEIMQTNNGIELSKLGRGYDDFECHHLRTQVQDC